MEMEEEKVEFWFILIVRAVLFVALIGIFIYDKVLNNMEVGVSWAVYGTVGSVVLLGNEALDFITKFFKK